MRDTTLSKVLAEVDSSAAARLRRLGETLCEWPAVSAHYGPGMSNLVALTAGDNTIVGVMRRHEQQLREITGELERARTQLMDSLVAGGLEQRLADALLSYVDLKVSTDVAVKDIVASEARALLAQMDPQQAVSATELAKLLGVSDETVRNREQAGELFSLLRPGRKRGREYPVFQTWEGIRGEPLQRILEALGAPGGAQSHAFFTSPNVTLGGLSPLQALMGFASNSVGDQVLELLQASTEERQAAVLDAARAYAADLAA
jgi:hypothetical protein